MTVWQSPVSYGFDNMPEFDIWHQTVNVGEKNFYLILLSVFNCKGLLDEISSIIIKEINQITPRK